MEQKTVCGLDVHKDSVFLCIITQDGELIEKKFGVLTFELQNMRKFMLGYNVEEVSMESTSVYWIPVWRVLESHFKLNLVNPYFIRQLPGRKSDIKDARWIATCTFKELVRGSYVPEEKIQELRQYDRRISDLNREIVRKLNKLDAVLQRCNIRLSNYLTNVNGKSFKAVINALCDGVTDPEELIKLVHGRSITAHGKEVILASLTGVISQAEKDVLRQLRDEVQMAQEHKKDCQKKMLEICKEYYPRELERLMEIPGVKENAAASLIAEIGVDMDNFETANHLASWSGLKPRNDESNGVIKSNRTTHGNAYLRQTIIQVAWGASRTKNTHFNEFYIRLTQTKKKNHCKAIVAVARKLLVAIWHILHDGVAYVEYERKKENSIKPAACG